MNYYSRNNWTCSSCQNIVYGNTNKTSCICGQTKWVSKQILKKEYSWRISDKICSNCKEWNFKATTTCRKCNVDL